MPKHTRRLAFHLSLRHDDPYELKVAEAIKCMPRAYAKYALVNMMREFIPHGMAEHDIYELLMDFARDVRPMRILASARVGEAQQMDRPEPRQPLPAQRELPQIRTARLSARELVSNLS